MAGSGITLSPTSAGYAGPPCSLPATVPDRSTQDPGPHGRGGIRGGPPAPGLGSQPRRAGGGCCERGVLVGWHIAVTTEGTCPSPSGFTDETETSRRSVMPPGRAWSPSSPPWVPRPWRGQVSKRPDLSLPPGLALEGSSKEQGERKESVKGDPSPLPRMRAHGKSATRTGLLGSLLGQPEQTKTL